MNMTSDYEVIRLGASLLQMIIIHYEPGVSASLLLYEYFIIFNVTSLAHWIDTFAVWHSLKFGMKSHLNHCRRMDIISNSI